VRRPSGCFAMRGPLESSTRRYSAPRRRSVSARGFRRLRAGLRRVGARIFVVATSLAVRAATSHATVVSAQDFDCLLDAPFLAPDAIPSVRLLGTGDFDGDGRQDVVAVSPSQARILFRRAGPRFESGPIVRLAHASALVATDVDVDGRLDLVVTRTT